jgi:hypothetical protein
MKELPATIVLRPFNFETLATQVYILAADERLAEAATPSLIIVAVGLIPVVLLSRTMRRVDVRAFAFLVRENDANLAHYVLIGRLVGGHQAGVVVMVADGDIAFTCRYRADLVSVAPLGRTGQVADETASPVKGLFIAGVVDHRSHQGTVVDVAAGTYADLALEFRSRPDRHSWRHRPR